VLPLAAGEVIPGGIPGAAAPSGIIVLGGYRAPDRFMAEGLRGGGAIIAASGSLAGPSSGVAPCPCCKLAWGVIGGGASGLATSSGSSPGKIQPGWENNKTKRSKNN
jgi:hypothetical protein